MKFSTFWQEMHTYTLRGTVGTILYHYACHAFHKIYLLEHGGHQRKVSIGMTERSKDL